MSVRNNPQLIFNLQINTIDEIERAIKSNEEEIAQILNDEFPIWTIEETVCHLNNIGDSFKMACANGRPFNASLEILNAKDHYHELLNNSMTICKRLQPLFIESVKCHQRAFSAYAIDGQKKSAIALMGETCAIAEKISSEYEQLGLGYFSLCDRMSKIFRSLVEDRNLFVKRLNDIETGILVVSDRELVVIQTGLAISDKLSVETIWPLKAAVMDIKQFCGQVQRFCKTLATSKLANPQRVSCMENEELQQHGRELLKDFEKAEMKMQPLRLQPKSLPELFKSMKAGKGISLLNVPRIFNKINSINEGIGEAFVSSYLNWLALAHINQEISFHAERGIETP